MGDIETSWSSSPNKRGRISSRGRKIKKQLPRDLDMPDVRTSSTWNGNGTTSDGWDCGAPSAFVPPLVSSSMQQPGNKNGSMPPREICITTKSHPGYHHHKSMPPPSQYSMYMPPAYSYPPPPHHSHNTRNAAHSSSSSQQSAPTTKTKHSKPAKKRLPAASTKTSPTILAEVVNGGRGQRGK